MLLDKKTKTKPNQQQTQNKQRKNTLDMKDLVESNY